MARPVFESRSPAAAMKAFPIIVLLLASAAFAPAAQAAATFEYTSRQPLHAVDPATGAALAPARERIGDSIRDALGITGTVGIARRMAWVDEDGQLFVQARMPQSMASQPHDLDVYVQDGNGMSLRGVLHYKPGKGLLVSRTFVFQDLPVGPVATEVHARGAHGSQWQEIVTQPVEVAAGSRLRFAFALRGDEQQDTPMELVVEARDELDPSRPPRTVFERRVTPGAGRSDWNEIATDLGDVKNRQVRFAFRSRPAKAIETTAVGVLWGQANVERDEKRRAYRALVVVSLDSLRLNSVGLYSGGDATPAIDRFFSDGTVMMEAVTQSVTTLPAHMTLMTGLPPSVHGVVDELRQLPGGVRTLAQTLQDQGWRTAAFTEGGALAGELGFARGFDHYDQGKAHYISPANSDALERAADFVDSHAEQPLFLFVHTYRTRPVHTGADVRSEQARRRELASMVEQVRDADEQLGALLKLLRERVIDDDSLFLLTSGHGEEFFEHGAGGHGTQLYEESVRVPLMLRGGMLARRTTSDRTVGTMDIARTVLDLLDVRPPASMQGSSFAAAAAGREAAAAAPRRFSEARRRLRLLADGTLQDWGAPALSVRDDHYKVIFHPASRALEAYDLSRDTREARNLLEGGRGPRWAYELADVLQGHAATLERPRVAPPASLEPINRRRLRSLGYLQ